MWFATVTIPMEYKKSSELTGRHHPRTENRSEDVLCDIVRDEVKVQRILAVEQNALDEGDNITCRVVFGTDYSNVYHLHSTKRLY